MTRAIMAALSWLVIVGPAAAALDSKLVDLTFLHRLQADKVPFSTAPLASSFPPRSFPGYPEITSQPYMQAAAEEILARLLAAHPGAKPAHVAFIVTTVPGFNCTTLPTGEIACTTAVLEMLLPTREGQTQLTFLLAHELGHRLIAGHGERFAKSDKTKEAWAKTGMLAAMALDVALSKRMQTGNTLTITPTPAATSAFWNSYFGGVYAGQTASGLESLVWSQKEEDEADQYGIFLMQRAGYDITEASQLFSALQEAVREQHMQHPSVTELVATKAANAAFLQAMVNGKSWINIVGGAVFGGFSATEEVAADHYHRDFGDRSRRCKAIVDAVQPPESDTDRGAFLAAYNAKANGVAGPSNALAAVPATPAGRRKATLANNVGGGRHSKAPSPSAPPPTAWELAQREDSKLDEIELAKLVVKVLANKGDKEALALCPTRPSSAELALSCGLALAGDNQRDGANALFKQALSQNYASPATYRTVALTQAQMKDQASAHKTLDLADNRFQDGEFYPDRISLFLKDGDIQSAKAIAERCQGSTATSDTKRLCSTLILQSKT